MARAKLTWHLEMVDWSAIERGDFGGDHFCNTKVENFFTLSDVWAFLGFKLKRQRCGYSGMRNNVEYVLLRLC